jgi:hypothetical protein
MQPLECDCSDLHGSVDEGKIPHHHPLSILDEAILDKVVLNLIPNNSTTNERDAHPSAIFADMCTHSASRPFDTGDDDEIREGEAIAAVEASQFLEDIAVAECAIDEAVEDHMISEYFLASYRQQGSRSTWCNCESEFGRNDDGEVRHFHHHHGPARNNELKDEEENLLLLEMILAEGRAG